MTPKRKTHVLHAVERWRFKVFGMCLLARGRVRLLGCDLVHLLLLFLLALQFFLVIEELLFGAADFEQVIEFVLRRLLVAFG